MKYQSRKVSIRPASLHAYHNYGGRYSRAISLEVTKCYIENNIYFYRGISGAVKQKLSCNQTLCSCRRRNMYASLYRRESGVWVAVVLIFSKVNDIMKAWLKIKRRRHCLWVRRWGVCGVSCGENMYKGGGPFNIIILEAGVGALAAPIKLCNVKSISEINEREAWQCYYNRLSLAASVNVISCVMAYGIILYLSLRHRIKRISKRSIAYSRCDNINAHHSAI